MSERRVYEVSGRSIAVLAAAIVVAAVLMPAGVMAATGSFVNLRDPWNTGTSGQARVVNNKLATEACDPGTTTASTTTCTRVDAGKLRVGDGSGALTVDGATRDAIPATPFVDKCNGSSNGGFYPSCSIAVPAGKRLVVETLSVEAAMPNGQDANLAYVYVTTGGTSHFQYFPLSYEATYPGNNYAYFTANPSMRLYADGGTSLTFEYFRNSNSGSADASMQVTGYLT